MQLGPSSRSKGAIDKERDIDGLMGQDPGKGTVAKEPEFANNRGAGGTERALFLSARDCTS